VYKGWAKEFDWLIWMKRSLGVFGVIGWVHGINSIPIARSFIDYLPPSLIFLFRW
jgi:hypothetical protein